MAAEKEEAAICRVYPLFLGKCGRSVSPCTHKKSQCVICVRLLVLGDVCPLNVSTETGTEFRRTVSMATSIVVTQFTLFRICIGSLFYEADQLVKAEDDR